MVREGGGEGVAVREGVVDVKERNLWESYLRVIHTATKQVSTVRISGKVCET